MATKITTVISTTLEVHLNSSIEKLMNVFLKSPLLLPEKLPDVYKTVNLSVSKDLSRIDIKIEYAPGCPIKAEVDRVEGLFPLQIKASYKVIGGDYAVIYESYESSVELVADKTTGGTKAIRTYKVKQKPSSPDLNKFIAFDIETLKKIDKIASALD